MNVTRAWLCLLVVAVLLRFGSLTRHPIWHDEVYTRFFASGYQASDWKPVLFSGEPLPVEQVLAFQRAAPDRGVADTVLGLAADEPQHPPLYYVLVRLWVGLWGDGLFALRALSATVSLLALPAGAWLSLELFGSHRAAQTTAGLLAVSPFFVLYAQEAREYALWSALILACSAALCRALRSGSAGAWALYAGLGALLLYTSFSSVAVLLAHGLFVLLRGGPLRGAVLAWLGCGLLFLPWAAMLWRHWASFRASMAWASVTVVPRSELLSTLALNLTRPVLDLWPDLQTPGAIPGVALGLLLVGLALASLRRAPRDAGLLLGLLFAAPIALLLGPDLLLGGIRSVSTRYLTASLLAMLLALGAWLSAQRPAYSALVLGLGLVSCLHNARQPSVWTKGVSASLPQVAALVNRAPQPLVVGNMERHHPGNLLALCWLLEPDARLQFLPPGAPYTPQQGEVFLFSPIPPFLDDLRQRLQLSPRPLYEDLHLSLWELP
jgi:uncharacterized membrane protein